MTEPLSADTEIVRELLRFIADEQVRTNALLERIAVAVEARVPAARPKREKAPLFAADSPEFKLAVKLWTIVNGVPAGPDATALQRWARDFRLITQHDNHAEQDIRRAIDFATMDTFWSKVILSPKNLRKNWDRIAKAMQPARPAVTHFERVEKKL